MRGNARRRKARGKGKPKGSKVFVGKGKGFLKGGEDWFGKGFGYEKGGKRSYEKGDYGKGGRNTGKGYQGTCWHCGKVGHKAAECGGKGEARPGVQAVEQEVADVGGVWTIAAVDEELSLKDWEVPVKVGRVPRRPRDKAMRCTSLLRYSPCSHTCGCSSANSFKVLESDEEEVCTVEEAARIDDVEVAQVQTEITVDSAAEESVCPQAWAAGFGLQAADRQLKLVNASGGRIEHFGKRAVSFNPMDGQGRTMEANFEVTNVRKPLMAVARMVDAGNLVQFGPKPEDNYIQHVGTKEKVYMKRKGNSFVIRGELADAPF